MRGFKVKDIVFVPIKRGTGIGEITRLETMFGIESAWVYVLGVGELLYELADLKLADLKILLEDITVKNKL